MLWKQRTTQPSFTPKPCFLALFLQERPESLCQFLAHQELHTSFAIDDACDLRKLRAEFVSEKHRLANPGKIPAFLIEVQSGPYLDEDDITRFEDIYGRSASEN